MSKRETSIERLLHGIMGRIEEWRGRLSEREAELQAHRERLLSEAAERERLLTRAVSEREGREHSLEEAAKDRRVAFVGHSKDAGEALVKFASDGARLVSVVSGSEESGADIKGSWLVFEQEE